ncbi:MAG: type II toxin-antitoxin system PemK/MazF family toxin [Planctomycetes bacterium]|nr:type II toxin-antitoxin system PemK/MazF family toxin [Planctomycetota bacterium]
MALDVSPGFEVSPNDAAVSMMSSTAIQHSSSFYLHALGVDNATELKDSAAAFSPDHAPGFSNSFGSYQMAAPTIRLGQIVWAEIADANGIRKARPAVVVTATDQIVPGGDLEVVAITSRIPNPVPDDHVLLPWHANGHPRTGLNRRSAAVCSWVAVISTADVQSIAGLVPAAPLLEVISKRKSIP